MLPAALDIHQASSKADMPLQSPTLMSCRSYSLRAGINRKINPLIIFHRLFCVLFCDIIGSELVQEPIFTLE